MRSSRMNSPVKSQPSTSMTAFRAPSSGGRGPWFEVMSVSQYPGQPVFSREVTHSFEGNSPRRASQQFTKSGVPANLRARILV